MPKKITEIALAASLAPADNPTFYVEKGGTFRRVTLAQLDGCLNDGITAAPFSEEAAYAAGDYVVHDGQLYRFNADHAAGAWTGTDVSACTMADEMSSVKNALGATLITDTASGAIATFTDGSDGVPMESVVVSMEPVQDLHGQANPYPAGGGKNLVDMNLTSYTDATEFVLKQGTYTVSTKTPTTGEAWYFSAKKSDNSWCTKTELGLDTFNEASASGLYYGGASNSNITFICPEDNVTFKIGRLNTDGTNPLMVEKGSTATAYAPYSNICPISGRSEVGVTRAGKNLIPNNGTNGSQNGITWVTNDDGSITLSGTATDVVNISIRSSSTPYAIGRAPATLVCSALADYNPDINGLNFQSDIYTDGVYTATLQNGRRTYTFTSGVIGLGICRLRIASGTVIPSGTVFYPQIEVGSTATDYAPYTADTITVQLGQTVYGGTVDAVSGVMTVDRAMVDLGTLYWGYSYTQVATYYSGDLRGTILPVADHNDTPDFVCTAYPPVAWNSRATKTNAITELADGQIRVIDSRFQSEAVLADFEAAMNGVMLCYPLASPVTVQLNPQTLTTLLGVNNVWSDGGNVSVEYVADTKAYIAKVIAAALA